jgi:uncharacterized membrane protein
VVGHGLDVVADLLGDDGGDAVDLGVLEAELVAKVGVDLGLGSVDALLLGEAGVLTMPMRIPSTATTFWMVALRLAWLRQLPHDW